MTTMINIVIPRLSKNRLRLLKKEYETSLLNSKEGSDRAQFCLDVLDAIDIELEKRG